MTSMPSDLIQVQDLSNSSYPSPAASPSLNFKPTDSHPQLQSGRRLSAKALLNSANPPASALDALVMALQATADAEEKPQVVILTSQEAEPQQQQQQQQQQEEQRQLQLQLQKQLQQQQQQQRQQQQASAAEVLLQALKGDFAAVRQLLTASMIQEPKKQMAEDEDDPNATVPSSPTFFMKKPANATELQQLPELTLPPAAAAAAQAAAQAAAASAATNAANALTRLASTSVSAATGAATESGLTPSTSPTSAETCALEAQSRTRKMSISSQASDLSTTSSSSSLSAAKIYTCSIGNCDKKFSQVAHLRIHERCHSGNRPFACKFDGCNRAFSQLGNLKTHERKHTGERPYKCPAPDCDKTFTQLGNLKTHERIHDEVKPFICRLSGCGKTFSQLGNLKTHTTKMHPGVIISDEELAIRTLASGPYPLHQHSDSSQRHGSVSSSSSSLDSYHHDNGSYDQQYQGQHQVAQVVTHFNPYQRRPIKPQRSEERKLYKKIRIMIKHQQRVRSQVMMDGSEISDEMEE